MTYRLFLFYIIIILFIDINGRTYVGRKYIIKTEPDDMEVETEIKRMETNTSFGDYSSSHEGCSIRLECKTARIKKGSCHFT